MAPECLSKAGRIFTAIRSTRLERPYVEGPDAGGSRTVSPSHAAAAVLAGLDPLTSLAGPED